MNSSLFKLNDDRKTKKWKTHLAKTPPSPNQVDKFLIIHFFLLEKARVLDKPSLSAWRMIAFSRCSLLLSLTKEPRVGFFFAKGAWLHRREPQMERFSFSSSVASSYEMPIVTARRGQKYFGAMIKSTWKKWKNNNLLYDVFRVGWEYLCCEDTDTRYSPLPGTCLPGWPWETSEVSPDQREVPRPPRQKLESVSVGTIQGALMDPPKVTRQNLARSLPRILPARTLYWTLLARHALP